MLKFTMTDFQVVRKAITWEEFAKDVERYRDANYVLLVEETAEKIGQLEREIGIRIKIVKPMRGLSLLQLRYQSEGVHDRS